MTNSGAAKVATPTKNCATAKALKTMTNLIRASQNMKYGGTRKIGYNKKLVNSISSLSIFILLLVYKNVILGSRSVTALNKKRPFVKGGLFG